MINLKQALLNITRSRLKTISISSIAISCLMLGNIAPAYSQIKPEVWGSVGTKDDDISYAGGVKWAGFALEVGTRDDAVGGDFLTFFPVPFVSPYLGLGVYSGDETIAYSGGAHLYPGDNIFVGAGYHSIRGINGKLGFKF